MAEERSRRPSVMTVVVILGWLLFIGHTVWSDLTSTEVSYSQAVEMVETGRVQSVLIDGEIARLTPAPEVELNKGLTDDWEAPVPADMSKLETALSDAKVEYTVKREGFLSRYLWWLVPLTVFALIGLIIGTAASKINPNLEVGSKEKKKSGGILGFLNHRGRKAEKVDTRFSDVAGQDAAKDQLQEIVNLLKKGKGKSRLGGKVPKGVLLMGPPGTGKTLLAKATAGEAGVSFIQISGADFVEMFAGVGAGRVRSLFDQARKEAPCIVFIDEIDAVGSHRSKGGSGGDGERDQTINKLLVEMQGFDDLTGVVLIAATNRSENLDSALMDRFDRKITVGLPTLKGREEILRVHSRGKVVGEIDYAQIAKITTGMSGRELEQLFNEAALMGEREGARSITTEHLRRCIEIVVAGHKRKSLRLTPEDRNAVAVHEAGHAIAQAALGRRELVMMVSIIPRSKGSLGLNMNTPEDEDDALLRNAHELLDDVVILLAGRAAERLSNGKVSTAAHDDIKRATEVVRAYVTVYGFSPKLKNLSLYGKGRWSDQTQQIVDEEITRIVRECYERAQALLKTKTNNHMLTQMTGRLLDQEELTKEALQMFLREVEPAKPVQLSASA